MQAIGKPFVASWFRLIQMWHFFAVLFAAVPSLYGIASILVLIASQSKFFTEEC